MIHELRTSPLVYKTASKKKRTAIVRVDDRPYSLGDILILQEYTNEHTYTGREVRREVVDIDRESTGVPDNCVGLIIEPAAETETDLSQAAETELQ